MAAPPGRRIAPLLLLLGALAGAAAARGGPCPAPPPAPTQAVADVPAQPFAAAARRLADALELAGAPLSGEERARLERLMEAGDAELVRGIQELFDPRCLVLVDINPESRVKAERGPAPAQLIERGWRPFLVKVRNRAGVSAPLDVTSPNLGSWENRRAAEVRERWLDLALFDSRPLGPALTGLAVEYRLLSIGAARAGLWEARLDFDAGQGTQDLGFRSSISILFDVLPAHELRLKIVDEDGTPSAAHLIVRDEAGRVHPAMHRREAPDLFFQPQVYRHAGESMWLPPGTFDVMFGRGPEYAPGRTTVRVAHGEPEELELRLARWVDPAARGWYSSDHHVHAAGCLHFRVPSEGVDPEVMLRQMRGEGLDFASVLVWGLGFDHQRRFFGVGDRIHPLSDAQNVLRYDVEVSGFGPHKCGHLCLLGLREIDFPGTGGDIHGWPSWCLPVLRWARGQGALVGSGHSGLGFDTGLTTVPDYAVPPMNGIGAMETLVDVAHGAVDFLGVGDSGYLRELNVWYHLLSCGFHLTISGETDFPCLTGERVGQVRSYVRLERTGDPAADYERWLDGVRRGAAYVSDGRAHLFDFEVEGTALGEGDVRLAEPGTVRVRCEVAALLDEEPGPRPSPNFWSIEHARLPERRVPVEVVVNGRPVHLWEVLADGRLHPLEVDVPIERSSWIAVRVLGAAHTNPVRCLVDGAPVRASQASAYWCLEAVRQAWEEKLIYIRPEERGAARRAWDAAVEAYLAIAEECEPETVPGWPDQSYPFRFESFPRELAAARAAAAEDIERAFELTDELSRAVVRRAERGELSSSAERVLLREVGRLRRELAGERLHVVDHWWVLGPFPAEPLEARGAPEAPFDRSASFPGLEGRERWKLRQRDELSLTRDVVGETQTLTYYAVVLLDAEAAGWAELRLGYNTQLFHPANRIRAWVNGDLVYEKAEERELAQGRDRFHARLREGLNELRFKLVLERPPARLSVGIFSAAELTSRGE